jgi:hypothetical protein
MNGNGNEWVVFYKKLHQMLLQAKHERNAA